MEPQLIKSEGCLGCSRILTLSTSAHIFGVAYFAIKLTQQSEHFNVATDEFTSWTTSTSYLAVFSPPIDALALLLVLPCPKYGARPCDRTQVLASWPIVSKPRQAANKVPQSNGRAVCILVRMCARCCIRRAYAGDERGRVLGPTILSSLVSQSWPVSTSYGDGKALSKSASFNNKTGLGHPRWGPLLLPESRRVSLSSNALKRSLLAWRLVFVLLS